MEKKRDCCVRFKSAAREEEEKKLLSVRINRIVGQMNGIKKMIEDDRYCDDILVQLSAVDKSVKSLATVILETHMRTCMLENIRQGNTEAVEEIVELFKRFL